MDAICFVFGTRPEFIKMLPLILESKKNKKIKTISCSTGQHKEMLNELFEIFKFKPDIDLHIMRPKQNLADVYGNTFKNILKVFRQYKPKWVVVQGDTTSAYAAAMAAFYEKIDIAHIEAGLRTYDINSPFPEELNRRAIGLVAKAHFCPTEEAALNIRNEKIDKTAYVLVTGNTGIDTLKLVSKSKMSTEKGQNTFKEKYNFLNNKKFILATMHRRENFGKPQEEILNAFLDIVKMRNINILFPVHLNPNVRVNIEQTYKKQFGKEVFWLNSDKKNEVKKNESVRNGANGAIYLADPLSYPSLISAMQDCNFLMTDSGGLQEEAPSFGKKILVLRTSTERPEGVAAGFSQLVGTDRKLIVSESIKLIDQKQHWSQDIPVNPYGDGNAAEKIMNRLLQ
jgi:UDP-N-acetylglucosamine 2-epimerase (non-hydrolysing)